MVGGSTLAFLNEEFGGAKHRILGFSYVFEKPFQSLSLLTKSASPPRRELQTERAARSGSVVVPFSLSGL